MADEIPPATCPTEAVAPDEIPGITSPTDAVAPEEIPASDSPPAFDDPLAAGSATEDSSGELDSAAIDELLKAATFEDPVAAGSSHMDSAGEAGDFKLPDFQQVMRDAQVSSIDLLRDVDLDVKIELGRSRMLVEDVLKLTEGSVVELDKLAGDPVDVFVNDRLVARGEVLVLNDNFCVRINEIVAGVRTEGV